ncbi:MAG: HEAT repeat domain-containing protein [Acidobacteria bacterium]|nr:HEAT repeat domain-containing protein [Acidobacteriota bacterium]
MPAKAQETVVGVFAIDRELTITIWDEELTRLTGIAAEAASGRRLGELFPELKARGLLERFDRVLHDGVVEVLAPALHGYLFRCPPKTPSFRFQNMQQRVTIAPLREGETISGALVTVEDVTERLDREHDLTEQLASPEAAVRLKAAEALAKAEIVNPAESLVGMIGDENWRVRQAAIKALTHRVAPDAVAALFRLVREKHGNFSLLNSALQVLAMSDVDILSPLISLLNDPDAGLRMQAALVLGARGDERAVPALTQALQDPDTNVRYHAIEALGNIHASSAVDVLATVAESRDFFLAFPALDALKKIGDARVVLRLLPLLRDEMLCEPAAELLGELGDDTVIEPLAELLNKSNAPTAAVARAFARLDERFDLSSGSDDYIAERAGRVFQPTAVQNLLTALETARNEDLRPLATVLGWLSGDTVNRALTHLLGHPAARNEVVEALVRHGNAVTGLLVEQLAAHDLETRKAAVLALGRIGDPKATPDLVRVLTEDEELKVVAADALAKIGDQRAFEPLLAMIDHPDTAVRLAAIGALNSLGATEMPDRVMPLLTDPDPLIRESAVRIAGYFGYAGSEPALLERCQDSDERVRRAAVAILPYVEDPRVLEVLERALLTDTPSVRAAAAASLGHIEDRQALEFLVRALQDQDSWVRYFAARSLGRHRQQESLEPLAALAEKDPASYVRIAAIEALAEIGGARAAEIIAPFMKADNPDLVRVAHRSYRLALANSQKPRHEGL